MFDTHAHYDDRQFDDDRAELLNRLFSSGITGIVNAGTNKDTSLFSYELSKRYKNIYFTAGVHPEHSPDCGNFEEWLVPLLCAEKCVAVGEIGLDYHYDTPRDAQIAVFRRQLALAEVYGKPVVVHDREAHRDCLEAVADYPKVKGVFHSFSGSAETAEILVKAGWYVSFSGVVTFRNAEKTVKAAAAVPTERLLAETDCPYLAPHPHRGKRNDSGYMELTVRKLADIKGLSFETMENILNENARRLFYIS